MSFSRDPAEIRREIAEQEAVVRQTTGASDAWILRRRGAALWRLGENLSRIGRLQEAHHRLTEAVDLMLQFPEMHPMIVIARTRQAFGLLALEREEDALGFVERGISFGATAPGLPDAIPTALWLRMFILIRLSRPNDAFAAAQALIEEFDPGETPAQRTFVVQAFVSKGKIMQSRKERGQALAAFEAALERCSADDDLALATELSEAMVGRASVLEELGRTDEAIQAYEAIESRLGNVANTSAREAVAGAEESKARLSRHQKDER